MKDKDKIGRDFIKKHKLRNVFLILLLIICIAVAFTVYVSVSMADFIDKVHLADSLAITAFQDAEPTEVILTAEDKERDFLHLYKSLKKGCPGANIKVNGKSFVERKDEYIELVKNTENNYEYFCVLNSIITNIPSCHTSLLTDPESIKTYANAINAYNVLTLENESSYTAYWDSIYKENSKGKYDISSHVEFLYVGGQYIYSPNYSCLSDEYESSILISVNDIPIDEYVTKKTYPSVIRYDSYNQKWYHKRADFNTINGEEAELKIRKADGTEEILNLYFDITASVEFLVNYADEQIKMENPTDKCYFFEINNGVGYLNVKNFSDDSIFEIEDKLAELPEDAPLIIDMRENIGGLIVNITDYFYPMLYDTPIDYTRTVYVKSHGEISKPSYFLTWVILDKNEFVHSSNFNAPINGFYYKVTDKMHIAGNTEIDRDIYFLIGSNSFSAADMLANMAKGQDKTILIGSNTGGEGSTSNFYMDILPESKMMYIYTPSFALNSNGEDNAIYGTAPDIYVELSVDSYIKKQQIIADNKNPYTYENRLKWDDVLIETLEIIKEKENSE